MSIKRKNGLQWGDDSSFLSLDFINDFSQNFPFLHQDCVNGWQYKFHQLPIGVEASDNVKKCIHDSFGIVVDFLSLNGFVFLCNSEEVFD